MNAPPNVALPQAGKKRINLPLQGARGLFCLFVFVFHIYNSKLGTLPQLSSSISNFFFRPLQYGVELFFGLSGYFIVRMIKQTPSLSHYAWDRATRIYPMLWLTILAIIGIDVAFHQRLRLSWALALSFLTAPPFVYYDHINPIAWTLDYEVTFYVYCGICWMLRRHIRWIWPLLALPAVAAMLVYPRVTMMGVGAIIGAGLADRRGALSLSRHPGLLLLVFLAGWHILVLTFGGNLTDISPLRLPFVSGLLFEAGTLLVCIAGGLALLGISKGHGALGEMLSSRPFVFMGTISYSFYLWHIPVMGGVKRLLLFAKLGHEVYSQAIFLVICFSVSLPLAWLSYQLVEVRATRWLRNIGGLVAPRKRDAGQAGLEPLVYGET